MSQRELALVRKGLEAWRQGDLGGVKAFLHPAATWRGFEPGEWDCANREDVVRTLRERYEQGFGRVRMELVDAGPGKVVAVSWPRKTGGDEWPEETATVISVRDERIVSIQDYTSRGEALAAVRAAEAFGAINADHERHCRAARAIAEEHFDARRTAETILNAGQGS